MRTAAKLVLKKESNPLKTTDIYEIISKTVTPRLVFMKSLFIIFRIFFKDCFPKTTCHFFKLEGILEAELSCEILQDGGVPLPSLSWSLKFR